jgi:hypothetical protein
MWCNMLPLNFACKREKAIDASRLSSFLHKPSCLPAMRLMDITALQAVTFSRIPALVDILYQFVQKYQENKIVKYFLM